MSNTASPSIPFIYYREYFRVIATAYVSEEGIFKERPANVTTPMIEVTLVYRIAVVTDGGEIQIVDFDNPPMMDKDKKKGGPVRIDGKEWYVEGGDSATPLECKTVISSRLPGNVKSVAEFMYALAARTENIQPSSE
jgi:hypothetical protein